MIQSKLKRLRVDLSKKTEEDEKEEWSHFKQSQKKPENLNITFGIGGASLISSVHNSHFPIP